MPTEVDFAASLESRRVWLVTLITLIFYMEFISTVASSVEEAIDPS